jgi:P27 family predicted phage terminase small subunit
MKGRKPKPTVLHLLAGTDRPRNERPDEPQPLGELIAPPENLNERERVIWQRTISRVPVGLLRELDSDVVQLYVETWVEREEARAKLKEFGTVVKSPTQGVPIQSPYKAIENKCTETLKGLMSDLGFNPTSRSRITISGSGAGKANKFSNNAAKKQA